MTEYRLELVGQQPRVDKKYKHRGRGQMGACGACEDAVRFMCRDREQAGRHVMCEIPDSYDMEQEA
jgi:hypothetical protein